MVGEGGGVGGGGGGGAVAGGRGRGEGGGSKYYGHNKMTPLPSPNLALQNQRCFL